MTRRVLSDKDSCLFSFRSRKKIAKYKAAAAVVQKSEGEELLVISPGNNSSNPSPLLDRLLQGDKPSSSNGEVSELKAGNIVVTWKDGNKSCLYSDPAADEEKQEEKQEEVSAAELEADEAVKMME